MSTNNSSRRGPPPGNQNARKHGFYSPELDEAQKRDLVQAVEVEGIDEEIAILRVKLKAVLRKDPDNIRVIMLAIESLAKVLREKYKFSKNDKKGLGEVVGHILKDIAVPLGVDIGKVILKKDDV